MKWVFLTSDLGISSYFYLVLSGLRKQKWFSKVYFILKGLSRVWKSSKSFQNHQTRCAPSFLNGLLWKGADSEWLFSDQRSLFRVKYAIKSYCIERGTLTNSNRIKIASQDHKLNANRIIKETARYSHAETKI